jgi:hypothetical protein
MIQKHAWERLEASLKLNGSVWVKAAKKKEDRWQFIRNCSYQEMRMKNVTRNDFETEKA